MASSLMERLLLFVAFLSSLVEVFSFPNVLKIGQYNLSIYFLLFSS